MSFLDNSGKKGCVDIQGVPMTVIDSNSWVRVQVSALTMHIDLKILVEALVVL